VSEFLTFTIVGLTTGAVYAVAASGLVVTYTTSGIFNFAHGAMGMVAAFLYWELRVNQHWPAPFALIAVILVIAPVAGALIERFLMRGLHDATFVTSLVVTIGLMLGLVGLANTIWEPESRQLPEFFGRESGFRIVDAFVSWHQVITVAVAITVAFVLRFILYRARIGVAMRAQVDDRNLAALNGGRPGRISMTSWAIGTSLAAVAGILLAPLLQLNVLVLTVLVVNAFAAAMVGRLKSLPQTFIGALVLGMAEAYAVGYLPRGGVFQNLKPAIPTLFLFLVLLALPEARLRGARFARAARTHAPSLRESLLGAGALVIGAYVLSDVVDDANLLRLGEALALGLIMLSLVPLTGYGGQVSLCQMTFAGLGAFTMVKLGTDGSPLALLAAAGLAAAVGAVVALPALRLQGLYLALATMAFAVMAENLFFSDSRVFGGAGTATVARIKLPGISFESERAYVMLLAVVFALVGTLVLALRRGPFGRRLAAMKDSPAACATLGLNLTVTKLAVFMLSAAIAGLGGALFGGLRQSAGQSDFIMFLSLPILLLVVIGGVTAVTGALLGGLMLSVLFQIIQESIPSLRDLVFLGTGLAGVILGRNPDGLSIEAGQRLGRVWTRWRADVAEPAEDEFPLPADALALEATG
jgi:branched-chain amino acid transport system permease protein